MFMGGDRRNDDNWGGSSSKGGRGHAKKPQPPKLYGILVDVSELSQVMVQRCCPVCTLVVRKFQARLLPTQSALPEYIIETFSVRLEIKHL